jgi:hypothetical protein
MRAEVQKLEPAYASASAQLQFPTSKSFRIDFKSGSGWDVFGPLEGETSRYQSQLFLHPKRLSGKTEDEISAQAMKDAQQLGKQTDLMAVRILMKTVKLEVGKEGKSLKVIEPVANDPDKHPLGGTDFVASL